MATKFIEEIKHVDLKFLKLSYSHIHKIEGFGQKSCPLGLGYNYISLSTEAWHNFESEPKCIISVTKIDSHKPWIN